MGSPLTGTVKALAQSSAILDGSKAMDEEKTGAISFRDISAVLPHHLEDLADVGVGPLLWESSNMLCDLALYFES